LLWKFEKLYLKNTWCNNVVVETDASGMITRVNENSNEPTDEVVSGFSLPGFVNAHSHAFQYAMAGLAEQVSPQHMSDDFWTWREKMYHLASAISPDDLEIIATELYTNMIQVGYTGVAEFHYLHHDKDGRPYQNIAEMSVRIARAAQTAGINLTLIPIFYQKGGFDKEAQNHQRRFLCKNASAYSELLQQITHSLREYDVKLGTGLHSLRAVDEKNIAAFSKGRPSNGPVHIHISEQEQEVKDCLDKYKLRPIEWLCRNVDIDDNWHLVHATHMTSNEMNLVLKAKSHIVLCPSTEGNLGDGLFPFYDFVQRNGSWSIGSDSHINLNPFEELRWLDYQQRLLLKKRNPLAQSGQLESGNVLFDKALLSGRRALGLNSESFEVGQNLDVVIIREDHPHAMGTPDDQLMSTLIFTTNPQHIAATIVKGIWRFNAHEINLATRQKWLSLKQKLRSL